MRAAATVTALGCLIAAELARMTAIGAAIEWDVDGIEPLLPRAETATERAARVERVAAGLPLTPRIAADPPPTGPVRNCAEWEAATGVLICYPLGLPYELLRDLDDDVTLHVVVSSGLQSTAQSNFSANGVDMSKVEFLVKATDSIWTRDYGPWFVFDGNGDFHIVDHVYNRPFRPNDDYTPVAFGQQQGISVIRHDMWHTGGNYMTDGVGVSSSTDLVYDEAASENGMSTAEVDALMADYYGVGVYSVVEDIETGGIHHIDTWGKFLDEETVLIKEVWTGHYTYDDLEQRATLIGSLLASTGRPYDVHRVYCHDIGSNRPASYTNSLLLNRRVYVPTFGNASHDANALAAYEAAMPGYDVRGYAYAGWLTDDALHCRAKGVMDGGMLLVSHVPIVGVQGGDVLVAATARDYSDAGVTSFELTYRQDGGAWESVAMSPVGDDAFEATIPAPANVGDTDYYLHAEDASSRAGGMPRAEPDAWYTFPHSPSSVGVEPAVVASVVPRSSLPNPFRAETRFSFEFRRSDRAELDVYDVSGRLVRRLAEGEFAAGIHDIAWDGRDDAGRRVAPGVYRFVLRAAGLVYARPVVRVE